MLNFGIIGCGRIEERHSEEIGKLGKLVAVCDTDENKLSPFSKKHNAHAYLNISALLGQEQNIDIIAVCTPNYLHAAHTIESFQHGFHVLCEKPMAIKVADCKQMIHAGENAGKELFIVKQNRFNPPVLTVKKLLEENKLGAVYSVHLSCIWNRDASYYENTWRGRKDMDGGILYTQFSHFIDLLQWMVGDVQESKGYAANFAHCSETAFEDTVAASLLFENGTIASLHCSTNSYGKNMEGSLTIIAEKGTVKIGGTYLNRLDYLHSLSGLTVTLPAGNAPNDYGTYQGSMSNHDKIYQHVVDVISRGQVNQFDGLDGLKTVKIIEKIYSAVR